MNVKENPSEIQYRLRSLIEKFEKDVCSLSSNIDFLIEQMNMGVVKDRLPEDGSYKWSDGSAIQQNIDKFVPGPYEISIRIKWLK